MDESTKRSIPPLWLAAAPLILKAGVVWLALAGAAAMADTHEATQFSVPAGSPDEYMQAGAAFARKLDRSRLDVYCGQWTGRRLQATADGREIRQAANSRRSVVSPAQAAP
jgi:hypothetical protein